MNKSILPRVGTFFILVGCGLLILFIGSVSARAISLRYLIFAAAVLFLGFLLRSTAPHPEPTRFSGIRRARQRSRQRREDMQKQKDEEKQTQKDLKK
jgi:hypothetical protein